MKPSPVVDLGKSRASRPTGAVHVEEMAEGCVCTSKKE
jgi:hypothetical protein